MSLEFAAQMLEDTLWIKVMKRHELTGCGGHYKLFLRFLTRNSSFVKGYEEQGL